MPPIRFDPGRLTDVLPPGGLTMVQGCSAESALLHQALAQAGDALGDMIFTGIFVPGVNRRSYLVGSATRTRTYFMTPELCAGGARVDYRPWCYADILGELRARPPQAALFAVSPPDEDGWCSFGPVVDFLAELWPRIPLRIAHINPALPRTRGHRGIPWSELTAIVEAPEAPIATAADAPDSVSTAIARHVAAFVRDGATLQLGIGKVPGAICAQLTDRRNLRLHSGLVSDGVLDLLDAGALAPGAAITGGVAIGSARLYETIGRPEFEFRPVSHTHDPQVLAALPGFVAINSALEVDLFGQAYAELTPKGLMSGPGGASDFARGARLGGGLRIIALPAAAAGGALSRIVAPGATSGLMSLGRFDIDIVATEHGAADLRGGSHETRAAALIGVAAPAHRATLQAAWAELSRRL